MGQTLPLRSAEGQHGCRETIDLRSVRRGRVQWEGARRPSWWTSCGAEQSLRDARCGPHPISCKITATCFAGFPNAGAECACSSSDPRVEMPLNDHARPLAD